MTNQDLDEHTRLAAREDWRRQCNEVTEAMKAHTRPFVVPLSREDENQVAHVGTGSFVRWNGRTILLTCEHVAAEGAANFSFHGSDDVLSPGQPFVCEKKLDAAVVPIGDALWNACDHGAQVIPTDRIAEKHRSARPEELFFFHGFAGENSRYAFGILDSAASAYVTQQSADAVEDDRIFELLWEPQQTSLVESTSVEVRKTVRFDDAGGFSGSLVWNTRYLEARIAGQPWTPEWAVVSGLLKRWDTGTKTLLVTRIEHVRSWLAAVTP